jgi:hypothetical protein
MDIKYVIRSESGVKDGQIVECPILRQGTEYTVNERTLERWQQSAGVNDIVIVDTLIPNPRKQAKKDAE